MPLDGRRQSVSRYNDAKAKQRKKLDESLKNLSEPLVTAHVPNICREFFDDDAVHIVDGGNTTIWGMFFHEIHTPNTLLSTQKFGMLGAGVAQALGAAVARAFEHERRSCHKLEVRFSFNHTGCDDGLTIIAGIADPDWAALDASRDKGVRRIAWSDLEPRAAELPSLVDEAVAELEANIDRLRRDETSKA